MKKSIIKLLSLMLAVIMLSTVLVSTTSYAASPMIGVSSISGNIGDSVDVTVSISDNPGIVSAMLTVEFDSNALTLTDVKDSGVLGTQSHKPEFTSPYTLAWVNDTATMNYTVNGTIATLTFKINSSAVKDNSYPVKISYDYDDYEIYNKDVEPIRFNLTNGSVKVTDSVISNPFKDVPTGSWFEKAALWCNSRGYITGTGAGTFAPDMTLTRAMFVQILAKVAGADLDSMTYKGKFKDVKSNDWFAKAVQWAVDNGITGGTGANTFSPNSPVTREQLATFFLAYARSKGYDTSASVDLGKYTDAGQVSSWAVNAVKWAVAEGLISGTSATTISPKTSATRAQAAVIFKNFVEKH